MPKKAQQDFIPLNVAVLTVSNTRVAENDTSGDLISDHLQQANHNVVKRTIEKEDAEKLFMTFRTLVDDPDVDVIISSGGTGLTEHDITPEVTSRLVDKSIPGFGELFRMLSYNEIGPSTIESRAHAGVANGTLVFLLPGSPGACRLAMDSIVLNQLDARTRPCNLVTLLPRILKK
ncbi:MAG: molybdopterin-binding protein [Arenicellales bacterium]|nr:molybdopterin-binding protein [Arenicellales bacterium]